MTYLSEEFEQGCCPKCGVSWDGGDIIDTFKKQRDEGSDFWKDKSDDDIARYVMGWSYVEILEFIKNNMSFDSKEENQIFLGQDRKDIHDYLLKNFNVDVKGKYSPPYRWSRVLGVEIQGMYDGISYWQCPDCKTTWSRFTLEEEEIQPISPYSSFIDKLR